MRGREHPILQPRLLSSEENLDLGWLRKENQGGRISDYETELG